MDAFFERLVACKSLNDHRLLKNEIVLEDLTRPLTRKPIIDLKVIGASMTAPRDPIFNGGKPPVIDSPDLKRVVALPRRPKPDEIKAEALIEIAGERFGRPNPVCKCRTIAPERDECIRRLRVTQAWGLWDIARREGLLGPINVGDGKSILDILAPLAMPNCRTALLLVPAKLIDQLVLEYRLVREHFKVPGLVVHGRDWTARVDDAPVLHVISYESLSRPNATTFLDSLRPDTIIADECDALKDPGSVRTGRLLRYFAAHPETRFCGWSGSMTDSSITDYAHLAVLALKHGSPLPLDPNVVDDWARAIDPSDWPAPPGALSVLCEPGEHIHSGFHRRLTETEGVVTSTKPQVDAELVIRERPAPEIPAVVAEALDDLRDSWMRPDGEELVDALSFFRCARELACGFYYRWIFTHGETVEEIEEWLEARKRWRRELREMLKNPRPHLDSPALLAQAAIRALRFPGGKGDLWYAPTPSSSEPLPHWRSSTWERWVAAKPLVNGGKTPETEPVRLHSYLAEDAAAWAHEHRGIVWYDATAFGAWVAEISGLPMHGGGPDAGPRIGRERGDRSIIASISSHGRGRNGLQFLFHEQLVAHPPASSSEWEQLLGRLHRSGQKSPVVTAEFYRHTPEIEKQVDQALLRSAYVAGTMGQEQKLREGLRQIVK